MATHIPFLDNLILSVIQGITEFLPISSSGHLLLVKQVFGITDFSGYFDLTLHIGSLGAVIWYFRNSLHEIVLAHYKPQIHTAQQKKLGMNLIIASIPIVIIALISSPYLEQARTTTVIAWASIIGAIILFIANMRASKKTIFDMNYRTALLIGIAQSSALIPGASRAGMAISGAMLLGFCLQSSARFAILLSIPTISLSAVWLLLSLENNNLSISSIVVGLITSFIAALVSIHMMLLFCRVIGILPFVIYRILLGILILAAT